MVSFMDSRSQRPQGRNVRRRSLFGGFFVLAMVTLSAGVFLPSLASADTSTSASSSPAAQEIIVCVSGTVDQGGVETSSSVASRVPAGTPVPEGCKKA